MTLAVQARVADVEAYLVASQSALGIHHLAVQVALREVVAVTTVDQLVAARADVRAAVAERVEGVEAVGIEVQRIEVKDIVLPAEVRRARAEVLLARAEGEAAALRSLANSARLAADTPALLQLRLLQELGTGSGHTIVVGTSPLGPALIPST